LQASHPVGLSWLGLTRLDLNVDPKPQILSTCKSIRIHITSKNITNGTEIVYTAIYDITLEVNPSRRVGLASWLRITPSRTVSAFKFEMKWAKEIVAFMQVFLSSEEQELITTTVMGLCQKIIKYVFLERKRINYLLF
jgi:ribulose bisphosphate carboxylase small subunit